MKRILLTLLFLLATSCTQPKPPYYPPLPDPQPAPVDPLPQPPPLPVDPAPTGALDPYAFVPLVKNVTTLEEAHAAVGKGTEPEGRTDDVGTIWYFYVVRMADGSKGDAVLGFSKDAQGRMILKWKHVGY